MIKYVVVEESLYLPEIGRYTSYGIKCVENTEKECSVVSFISDISTKKDFVASLAEKFTKLCLSPTHFSDAVEDALP